MLEANITGSPAIISMVVDDDSSVIHRQRQISTLTYQRKCPMRDYNNQPPGGNGKLRALLASLKEDQDKLDNHPIYREGYDDGFRAAQEAHKKLSRALAKVYNIDEWGGE